LWQLALAQIEGIRVELDGFDCYLEFLEREWCSCWFGKDVELFSKKKDYRSR
jgi:hypothetical protein